MKEVEVGTVKHFFDRVSAALIVLSGDLAVGDTIRVKGHTTDLTETVGSMKDGQANLDKASAGQSVGVKLSAKAREHDKVFKVVPD